MSVYIGAAWDLPWLAISKRADDRSDEQTVPDGVSAAPVGDVHSTLNTNSLHDVHFLCVCVAKPSAD